jgi:catechol 2,3-dioxygenase-like lactoylglutathione lyase family enzyme
MREVPKMAFAHMGVYVSNIDLMVEFYSRVLGFSVTDRAQIRGVNVAFLSRNPEEHHQIVLVPGRDLAHPSTINQISFRVISLAELRRVHDGLVSEKVSGLNPTNHGGSWSLYFLDPEGNRIELFVQTPWYMPPISVPLDLRLSDEEIHRLTEGMVEATPGHMARADWYEQTLHRMVAEGSVEQRGTERSGDGGLVRAHAQGSDQGVSDLD